MKVKLKKKTLKIENNELLKNKNFKNNQNYIKTSKSLYYY
jgi:hypothetical protein